jgi:hypothetical protein
MEPISAAEACGFSWKLSLKKCIFSMKFAFLVLINKIYMKISQVVFESNVVNKLVRNPEILVRSAEILSQLKLAPG